MSLLAAQMNFLSSLLPTPNSIRRALCLPSRDAGGSRLPTSVEETYDDDDHSSVAALECCEQVLGVASASTSAASTPVASPLSSPTFPAVPATDAVRMAVAPSPPGGAPLPSRQWAVDEPAPLRLDPTAATAAAPTASPWGLSSFLSTATAWLCRRLKMPALPAAPAAAPLPPQASFEKHTRSLRHLGWTLRHVLLSLLEHQRTGYGYAGLVAPHANFDLTAWLAPKGDGLCEAITQSHPHQGTTVDGTFLEQVPTSAWPATAALPFQRLFGSPASSSAALRPPPAAAPAAFLPGVWHPLPLLTDHLQIVPFPEDAHTQHQFFTELFSILEALPCAH